MMAHGSPDYSVTTLTSGGAVTIQPQKPYYNRDVVDQVAGDVVVFDPATIQGALACVVKSDPRVLGVVADIAIAPGVIGNLYYHGLGLVKVIGAGVAGSALITSATSGAAQANGTISDQPGFIGVALESWAGPGLILADIDINTGLYAGQVLLEGSSYGGKSPAHAPANLQCGVNPFRAVLVFHCDGQSGGAPGVPLTPAKVNGVDMTVYNSVVVDGPALIRITTYILIGPNTGLQAVSLPSSTSNNAHADQTLFFALSGVKQAGGLGSVIGNYLAGVNAISDACSDAIAGDLTLGALFAIHTAAAPVVSSRGAGQTMVLNGNGVGATWYITWDGDYKTASVINESQSWVTVGNVDRMSAIIIPVHPA